MKAESIMMRLLFAATLLITTSTLASMLWPAHAAETVSPATAASTASAWSPVPCPLPPDGLVCVRAD